MAAFLPSPSRPGGAEDIRHLQVGAHGARLGRSLALDGAHHLAQQLGGHVRVHRRGVDLLVPEQHLDDADVLLLLEQVGGKAVAQGITTLPITRGLRECVTSITRCAVKKWRSCARSGTGLIRA